VRIAAIRRPARPGGDTAPQAPGKQIAARFASAL